VALGFLSVAILLATPLGLYLNIAMLRLAIKLMTRYTMTPEALPRHYLCDGCTFLTAELDGKIVGCVAGRAGHTLRSNKEEKARPMLEEASVWRLGVHPGYRRLGIASKLMAALEAWAVKQGYRHLSLITGNPESQQFYRRVGYGSETEKRAVAVKWPSGLRVWHLPVLWMLRRRLYTRKTILVKHL
jgi:ribosomal protein S18 acetylase RimI-like enzyme